MDPWNWKQYQMTRYCKKDFRWRKNSSVQWTSYLEIWQKMDWTNTVFRETSDSTPKLIVDFYTTKTTVKTKTTGLTERRCSLRRQSTGPRERIRLFGKRDRKKSRISWRAFSKMGFSNYWLPRIQLSGPKNSNTFCARPHWLFQWLLLLEYHRWHRS